MATIKLGELLIKAKVLQEGQLKAALAEQRKWGGKLGEILVRMNFLTEDLLVKALSKQLALPIVNLDTIQGLPPPVKAKIPANVAREHSAIPIQLRDDGRTLTVAVSDPLNVQLVDTLRAIANCRIVVQLAGRSQILRAIARFYEGEAESSDFEGSFKVVDAGGRTVVKSLREIEANAIAKEPDGTPARAMSSTSNEKGSAQPNALELLKSLEEVQRKEVSALKAMVELMIEKGVFTRDEYLAKVRR